MMATVAILEIPILKGMVNHAIKVRNHNMTSDL
jgi:hypothetical protein